jgi:hypothetical protein
VLRSIMRAALLVMLLSACGGPTSSSTSEPIEEDAPIETSGAEGEATSEDESVAQSVGEAPLEDHPDAQSNTPREATYTRCEPACEDCGLTIGLRRSMAWRPTEYEFEILSEGNHIRCEVTIPCSSTEPVECRSSPGAPRVTVETAGCGGPVAGQRIVALHMAACPTEARVEAFRGGIGAGNEAITPRYEGGRATGTFTYRR